MSQTFQLRNAFARFCYDRRKIYSRQSAGIYTGSLKLYAQDENKLEQKRKELMARGLPKLKYIRGVKHVLLVASGKGGVGKSTLAVNLSTAIKVVEPRKLVGLLDSDVHGPSIPLMMNIHESPEVNEEHFMEPLINYGIKCMSIGFLTDDKSPFIWRGPMVMSAIEKLLFKVAWDPLDYLIVDTPPGTGDSHLTLLQHIKVSAALLVTTPHKAAVGVTHRGAGMFKKMNVPIIGVVENMDSIKCPKCATDIPLSGSEMNKMTRDLGLQILQKIPMSEDIAEGNETGKPVVLSKPESTEAEAYKELARKVIAILDALPPIEK